MTFARAKINLPGQKVNEIGLALRDYEGALSTLCAGCGHDSITAALVQALWEMSISPEQLIKMSGIGCSSKTPAYFVHGAHGFLDEGMPGLALYRLAVTGLDQFDRVPGQAGIVHDALARILLQ